MCEDVLQRRAKLKEYLHKMKRQRLRILFIGNSHTYYNDMPELVRQRAEEDGFDCDVVMLAHPGWYLEQHAAEPDVSFNIRRGHYDYVVLQEHSHPFGPVEKYYSAVRKLDTMIRNSGAKTVLFLTWAKKDEPEKQPEMTAACREIAAETGALAAPVGEQWWPYMKNWPDLEMYADDGAHPSFAGSDFAAKYIWETILEDIMREQ